MITRCSHPGPWAEHYEILRRHVLEGQQLLSGDPLGLVLLRRQGLAAWLESWEALAQGTFRPPPPSAEPPPALTAPSHQELARLLAQMTLPCLQAYEC